MRYIPATALGLVLLLAGAPVLILAGAPAFAQMSMGGSPGGGGGAPGGANTPEPVAPTHDIAPPALPGAGAPAPLATGPVVQKPSIADPTQALFAAVNNGDYNAAQDALSRGADLNAQNALGETPLDLSIALNRSTITFLLLATRNETGSTGLPRHRYRHPPGQARAPQAAHHPGCGRPGTHQRRSSWHRLWRYRPGVGKQPRHPQHLSRLHGLQP
jgi:hypothetical protein